MTLKIFLRISFRLLSPSNARLVEWPPDVNGRVLNHGVDDFGNGGREISVGELRVKEYLRTQETLIANVHLERLKKGNKFEQAIMTISKKTNNEFKKSFTKHKFSQKNSCCKKICSKFAYFWTDGTHIKFFTTCLKIFCA